MPEQKKGMENKKWNEVEGSAAEEKFGAFLDSVNDGYAILQLKETEEISDLRFLTYDDLVYKRIKPDISLYDCVYVGEIDMTKKNTDQVCDELFYKFNNEHPADYQTYSLSVSDVIALKCKQEVTFHFVDAFGFQELPGFDSKRNALRGIEDQIEQNDNQLDGIINNLPEETISEKEAKSSVREKLKTPTPEHERKAKPVCQTREL